MMVCWLEMSVSQALWLVQHRAAAIGPQLNLDWVNATLLQLVLSTWLGFTCNSRMRSFVLPMVPAKCAATLNSWVRRLVMRTMFTSRPPLRSCAGFAKLVHSMRCNPPKAQYRALCMFDGMVRRSFGDLTGLHPNTAQWQQASLGRGHAGLGLLSTASTPPPLTLLLLALPCVRLGLGFWLLRGSVEILSQSCLRSVYIQRHLAPEEHLALDAALSSKQHALSLYPWNLMRPAGKNSYGRPASLAKPPSRHVRCWRAKNPAPPRLAGPCVCLGRTWWPWAGTRKACRVSLHETLLWQPCAGRRLGASKSEGGCGGGHCLRPTQGLLPSDGAGLGGTRSTVRTRGHRKHRGPGTQLLWKFWNTLLMRLPLGLGRIQQLLSAFSTKKCASAFAPGVPARLSTGAVNSLPKLLGALDRASWQRANRTWHAWSCAGGTAGAIATSPTMHPTNGAAPSRMLSWPPSLCCSDTGLQLPLVE